jgi:hypothetical protein
MTGTSASGRHDLIPPSAGPQASPAERIRILRSSFSPSNPMRRGFAHLSISRESVDISKSLSIAYSRDNSPEPHAVDPRSLQWGHSLGIRIVSIVLLVLACGCVPPSKKATPTATRQVHHALIIRAVKGPDRALSDAEKDKLFRDFEQWNAAKQAEPRAVPQLGTDPTVDAVRLQVQGPTDGPPPDVP